MVECSSVVAVGAKVYGNMLLISRFLLFVQISIRREVEGCRTLIVVLG